jgi:hypothetical protein
VLLTVALLALAVTMLVWLPRAPSPQVLLGSLVSLILVDVGLVLWYGDYRIRQLFIRPVEIMVDQAEGIARGEHGRRLAVTGADELKRLAESVNGMADRLIHHQERLRRNVASLNETNKALSLAKRELAQSEKLAAVGRMAAGVAHEIGNPLGAILGYVEVATRRGTADPEWLASIRYEAERIDRVVRGLLDFSRPTHVVRHAFEVNDVIRSTVELLQTQGRLKTVRVEIDVELPSPRVTGDPAQLEQILVNLLLNADDAIAEARVPGRLQVISSVTTFSTSVPREPVRRDGDPDGIDYSHLRRHRTEPDSFGRFEAGDSVVRIDVVDNGVGISEGQIDSVFEPFFTTKEPGRGTGLGLAVSARLAEALGGGVAADSRPDEGTRFSLILPRAVAASQETSVEEVA